MSKIKTIENQILLIIVQQLMDIKPNSCGVVLSVYPTDIAT